MTRKKGEQAMQIMQRQQQGTSTKRMKRNSCRESAALPDDVLDNIFSFLPIKFAVKMGILASRFRHSWLYGRNLDFDEEFAEGLGQEQMAAIIDRLLELHMGDEIRRFKLFIEPSQRVPQVDEWIRFAAMKKVEEVDLDFSVESRRNLVYRVPDFLLECGSVRVLKLSMCVFIPPFECLDGLRSLTSLSFSRVDVTEDIIHYVLETCLLLQNLELHKCQLIRSLGISNRNLRSFKNLKITHNRTLHWVNIDAPTLHSLHFSGSGRIVFAPASTPNLKDAMLDFTPSVIRGVTENSFLESLPNDLVNVNILTVSSLFLQGLSPKYGNGELRGSQFSLPNLKEFQLWMETSSYCNPYDVALFLKNCPNLERIFIDLNGFSFYRGLYWEQQGRYPLAELDYKLQHLKFVRLNGFKFEEMEMLLVKFVLEKAVALEIICLVPHKNHHKITSSANMQVYLQLFHLQRASPVAKIIVYAHPTDEYCMYPMHSRS